jgi:sugar/nucleoside kinase (ribokinase family)
MAFTVLSQPMVDVLVRCEHSLLKELKFVPGSYNMTSRDEHRALMERARILPHRMVSGGSGANSAACAKILGIDATCLGLAGDDQQGRVFAEDLRSIGVNVPFELVPDAHTGTCISFITSGERTMRTHLGVGADFSFSDIVATEIRKSSWLLLEGYYLTTSAQNKSALYAALVTAQTTKTSVVFCVSAEFVTRSHREEIVEKILPQVTLLYANETEAVGLTRARTVKEAFDILATKTPGCIVTCGKEGAWISHEGKKFFVRAYTEGIVPVDATGAGDSFIGAYIAGIIRGYPPPASARGAARIAAAVVAQEGARLPLSAVELWNSAVA